MTGAMLRIELDRDQPLPLSHQIARTIRWKLGTGELRPGQELPTVRDAADAWDVNYHTVRRAYRILAEAGMVDACRGRGTRILPSASKGDDGAAADLRASRVFVAECNHHQARDLAGQVEAHGVTAIPWNFEAWGEPPEGPVLGTRFHEGEMLRRWPGLVGRARFLPLRPDPELADRLAGRLVDVRPERAVVLERDATTGRQQLAAVAPMLPTDLPRSVRIVNHGEKVDPSAFEETLLLVAPRLWDRLPDHARRAPDVLELRHIFDPADLGGLG